MDLSNLHRVRFLSDIRTEAKHLRRSIQFAVFHSTMHWFLWIRVRFFRYLFVVNLISKLSPFFPRRFDSNFLNTSIKSTNDFYGALNPNTTNVIYVHGSIDPWHALGLTQSTDPSRPTIYINGTAHCANMYEPKDTDFPQLKEARNKIRSFLAKILK